MSQVLALAKRERKSKFTTVSVSEDTLRAIWLLRAKYGFRSNDEAIRAAIRVFLEREKLRKLLLKAREGGGSE